MQKAHIRAWFPDSDFISTCKTTHRGGSGKVQMRKFQRCHHLQAAQAEQAELGKRGSSLAAKAGETCSLEVGSAYSCSSVQQPQPPHRNFTRPTRVAFVSTRISHCQRSKYCSTLRDELCNLTRRNLGQNVKLWSAARISSCTSLGEQPCMGTFLASSSSIALPLFLGSSREEGRVRVERRFYPNHRRSRSPPFPACVAWLTRHRMERTSPTHTEPRTKAIDLIVALPLEEGWAGPLRSSQSIQPVARDRLPRRSRLTPTAALPRRCERRSAS